MSATTEPRAGWRAGRWLAAVELALVVALLLADRRGLVPLSNTPFLVALGWASLRLRGLRWRDVGLVRPWRWSAALATGIVAGVAMEILALAVTEPWIARAFGSYPDLSDLRPLVGRPEVVLALLPLVWLGSCLEELVWRGWLMDRLAVSAGGAGAAWGFALVVSSALFGVAHGETQGLAGMLQEGLAGLLLGVLYLACRRRLAVPMVAHAAANTLAFALICLGRYPGV